MKPAPEGTTWMRRAIAATAVLAVVQGGCTTTIARRAAPLHTTASCCGLYVVQAGITAGDLVIELDAGPSEKPRRIHVRVPFDEFYDDIVSRRASRWVSSAASPAPGTHVVRVTAAAVRPGAPDFTDKLMPVLAATAASIEALQLDPLAAPAAYNLEGPIGAAAFALVLDRGGRSETFVIEVLTAGTSVPSARAPRVAHGILRVAEGLFGILINCFWLIEIAN